MALPASCFGRFLLIPVLLMVAGVIGSAAQAQNYPAKPIRMVVGFPPGGASDTGARHFAPRLGQLLGQQIIVDNRPGANTNIAIETVARAQPDGYTLLWGFSNGLTVNPSLYKNATFHPQKDLLPVSLIDEYQFVLVVHKSVTAGRLGDLISLIKAGKPGEFTYGSTGLGSQNHLSAVLMGRKAGIEMTHVPYKGGGPATLSVVAGETRMLFASIPSVLGHIQGGNVRPFAVTAPTRAPELPDVPTMQELGFADFDVRAWDAILVPAGTPAAIIAQLNREIARVAAMPEIQEAFKKVGLELSVTSPEQLAARIRRETAIWSAIVKEAGISLQ